MIEEALNEGVAIMGGNQPVTYQVPTGVGFTAVGVAAVRAQEGRRDDPLFDDPLAAAFVTAAGDALACAAEDPSSAGGHDDELWSLFFAYLPIRTRFFDDYFRAACAQGCRQAVILAAGLDTRAFRLAWPVGVRLFELDTPEVLAFKDQVLAERGATPACQRVSISADLRHDWPAAALRAGFDPSEPTAWLAEGLLLYLNQNECDHLLEDIGQLSAPNSQLAIEYVNHDTRQGMLNALSDSPGNAVLKSLWQSGGQDDPTSWLRRHGWQAHSYNATERAQSYGRVLPGFTGPAGEDGFIIARRV